MDKLGNKVYLEIPPEKYNGNIEYKWSLENISNYKRTKIVSQMAWRVNEESDINSALYVLGVHDNGHLTGLDKNILINTYTTLLDCINLNNMYSCLRIFTTVPGCKNKYWAVVQIFNYKSSPKSIKYDNDLPKIPLHPLPDFLKI